MDYIKGLTVNRSWHQAFFVHGFWPDSVRHYLHQMPDVEILHAFEQMEESICFLGHTHQLELIEYDGKRIERKSLKKETVYLNEKHRYIINIGSVGQPRDGNNNAKYVIWEPEIKRLELRFVPYDIESVVKKIIASGLPAAHAYRLR